MSRRLEDHIRDLCAHVVAAEGSELEPKISELKSALHEHTARLRKMVVAKLSDPKDRSHERTEERRSHSDRRDRSARKTK